MSSLKNIDKHVRRTYKERSQPSSRKHLGELEKKKDYKLRAKDFQRKRDTLKKLSLKALERNRDEFYFHMINCKTEDGKVFEKSKTSKEEHTAVQAKLINTQDERYINFKMNMQRLKIEKALANLQMLHADVLGQNTHTFFVDSKEEARNFDPARRLATHPRLLEDDLGQCYTMSTLEQVPLGTGETKQLQAVLRQRNKEYVQLLKRIKCLKELQVVRDKLEADRHVKQSKAKGITPLKVIDGTTEKAAIYKWRWERKR